MFVSAHACSSRTMASSSTQQQQQQQHKRTSDYREDFFWSTNDAPHAARRRLILKAHPDISSLMGPEWRSKWITLALVAAQIWLSVATRDLPWAQYLAVAYIVGATITQALCLAIHELAHNLFFKEPLHNRCFSFVANLPIVIPFSISFRSYHLMHHKHLGIDGVDADIPSLFECRIVQGPLTKAIWAVYQMVAYATRPMFVKPLEFTAMLLLNWTTQVVFDVILWGLFGWKPLFYMLLCLFLSGSLHPCAGHFISEHYVFPHKSTSQETYSYYGALNYVTFNVGYHVEHHDFPFVAWSRLPLLKRTAPEFYKDLQVCESWVGVIFDYIRLPEVGPYNRVKRKRAVSSADEAKNANHNKALNNT